MNTNIRHDPARFQISPADPNQHLMAISRITADIFADGQHVDEIGPVLQARLEQSRFADWQGQLYLDAGAQTATLQIETGKVQVTAQTEGAHAIHGGAEIARLLIGSDEPQEIIRQAKMTCTGRAAELASALFPNMYPMMSHWDEY